ncbi:MAG TPA: GNAT family N-acetyltransferase [Planctomycetota bacterium]|nr:GNAT family N-acetyltransferase [Planctomycetota bacterium]
MEPQRPTLTTERLILRPYALEDAADVQRLCGDRRIAETTLNIPHPYPDGAAQEWISTHAKDFAENKGVQWAITLKETGELAGGIGLTIQRTHDRAEVGYWIAAHLWSRAYCTEAAREVVGYGFKTLNLNRIYASHFARNPASGRVMQKLGMSYEGRAREGVKKWDRYEDLERYAILRAEWK